MKRTIIDISQPIETGMAVWPGDTAYTVSRNLRLEDGATVNLSDIRMSLHTGTHADAPGHFLPDGRGIDAADLSAYLGPARVVHVPADKAVPINVLQRWDWSQSSRCLLKTGAAGDRRIFDTHFMPLSEDAALYLVEQGVRLVGTDAPSVDAFGSRELPVHRLFGLAGVAILENLELSAVSEGMYELIALPLRLMGLEGSPVRAVLRSY